MQLCLKILLLLVMVKVLSSSDDERTMCCSNPDQVMDAQKHTCHHLIGKLDNYSTDEEPASFNCSNSFESILLPSTNQSIPQKWSLNDQKPNNFCYQPSTDGGTIVLYCIHPSKRIRKCCPSGQSVNRTSIEQCIPQNSSLPIGLLDSFIDHHDFQDDYPLRCEHDYNIYLPGYYMDHKFKVRMSADGSNQQELFVPKAAYAAIRHSSEYCVDTTLDGKGQMAVIAMMCLPKSFYVMRWLLHNVYSIINFISAVLVLITFLVHILLPPLRNNIQGLSMICFLLCLVIMHFENGIFLAKKYEPHTWCLNRACVSGYFRLASSTWITVMGFNIWRQLRDNVAARRKNRMQVFKGFFWRSIYAWGLPLVFELTAHFYKQNYGCPEHLKRCWSCDIVSRNLAQTPNVILVTGNLIFFIPSALKVYKSIGFVRQASIPKHSLDKMERNRILTIFRLFVLMQFYTVPRIIQWFVDADWAKPELLIVCATLFLLIGPCVFFSFVCRMETISMLKEIISRPSDSYFVSKCQNVLMCGRIRSYDVSRATISTVSEIVTCSTVQLTSSIQNRSNNSGFKYSENEETNK